MQYSFPFLIETPPAENKRGRERYVLLEGKPVAYTLRRSARRTIGIAVDEHGLEAAAPRWVTIAEIEAFIVEKRRWILRHLTESRRRVRPLFVWQDGARIPYLGGEILVRAGAALQLQGNVLEAPAEALRENVIAWLKARAFALFQARIAALAAQLRLAPPSLGLSQARTQWGNCTRKPDGSARVLLNWKLVHYEPQLIDYVVAHELAHLRHMNHSAAFWREVGRACPDYLAARRELRDRAHWAPEL